MSTDLDQLLPITDPEGMASKKIIKKYIVISQKVTPIKLEELETPAAAEEGESPKTPTAAEHRIPGPGRSPPPAPRKRRRVGVPPCKRRLDFFDRERPELVQEFFNTSFAEIQKRRCVEIQT